MKLQACPLSNFIRIVIPALFLLPAACAPAVGTPSDSAPGMIVTATETLAFTETPVPTVTPPPPLTFTPTPTVTPLIPEIGQVIFHESFDDLDFPFNVIDPPRIESGVIILGSPGTDQAPGNGIYGTIPVPPGATTIVLFKTMGGTEFNIGYHTGEYRTPSLRRVSFNSATGAWDIYLGEENRGDKPPAERWQDLRLHYDTWHYFSITCTTEGEIFVRIWDRDDPSSMIEFQRNMGSEWGTLPFTFFVDFQAGSFLIDEYQVVQ